MYLLRYVVLYFKFLIMFTHNNNLLSILIEYGKDIFLEEKKKGHGKWRGNNQASIFLGKVSIQLRSFREGNRRVSIGSQLILIKASAVIVHLRPLGNIIKPEVFCMYICFKHV